jgi:hypothetical protein
MISSSTWRRLSSWGGTPCPPGGGTLGRRHPPSASGRWGGFIDICTTVWLAQCQQSASPFQVMKAWCRQDLRPQAAQSATPGSLQAYR